MDIYERSLKAIDELFSNTTAEELERDYLAIQNGVGITIKEYLEQSPDWDVCSGESTGI